ncbi:winged helix-turn-helix domain-containing protein [Dactylosporangium sp. CA-092794]|uniref:winged helix-turn-helix domain-containing protein n=1 Tax=Dactylosporangium sp. CA-092794 TaxID=3239929 RepID=UPI003D90B3A5
MLDRRSGQALYRQLADTLRDRILAGDLPPGGELPSEGIIAKSYNISRDAVRQAIAVLRSEGLIVTVRGRRSSVRRQAPLEEVRAPAAARITARMPTSAERTHFDVPEGVPLLVVQFGETEELYAADRVVVCTPPPRKR